MTTQTLKHFIDFLNKTSENIFVNLMYKNNHKVGWCNTPFALYVSAATTNPTHNKTIHHKNRAKTCD